MAITGPKTQAAHDTMIAFNQALQTFQAAIQTAIDSLTASGGANSLAAVQACQTALTPAIVQAVNDDALTYTEAAQLS